MTAHATYAVIGLGLFGSAIARTLAAMGHHVLAVDQNLALVEAVGAEVSEAVQADATERAALESLHIARYDIVFNTIGDLTASILCTLVLRELGVRRIIAKINSLQQGRILSRLGAEEILFPERDMGERVARQIAADSSIISHIDLSRDASLLEMAAPRVLVGRSLGAADVRRRFGITVVALRRRGDAGVSGEVVVSPATDTLVEPGDVVLVGGRNEDLSRFQRAEE